MRLTFATRESIEQFLVTLAPTEELSAFAVVGQLNEDMTGMISRMDFLPVMVPNQATWQAELAYVDLDRPAHGGRPEAGRGGDGQGRRHDRLAGHHGLDGFANEQRIQIMRAIAAERAEIERLVERSAGRSRPSWRGSGPRSAGPARSESR